MLRIKNLKHFLILILAVSVCISGIAEANNAPTTVGTIPNQTLTAGGMAATIDVSGNFSDSDGDTLTYTATSSDTAKATVSVSTATVTTTLITNTEMATADTSVAPVVIESFALPQSEFALILRSPNVFGDIAGNYYEGEKERPETAPAFTIGTVWERTQPIVSGYRSEAWAMSTHRNGLGSPGYQPSPLAGDLNNDSVVNILDLVMVASKFGTNGTTSADLNGDNTVDIRDLVLVAGALSAGNAAPTAKQSDATVVNNWLKLARQYEKVGRVEHGEGQKDLHTVDYETRQIPKGFPTNAVSKYLKR